PELSLLWLLPLSVATTPELAPAGAGLGPSAPIEPTGAGVPVVEDPIEASFAPPPTGSVPVRNGEFDTRQTETSAKVQTFKDTKNQPSRPPCDMRSGGARNFERRTFIASR